MESLRSSGFYTVVISTYGPTFVLLNWDCCSGLTTRVTQACTFNFLSKTDTFLVANVLGSCLYFILCSFYSTSLRLLRWNNKYKVTLLLVITSCGINVGNRHFHRLFHSELVVSSHATCCESFGLTCSFPCGSDKEL